ncbi:MAG: helix-turn-helix transcriptional regulator [Candidatus Sedimenticola sp. (ex Thyasira tokunagai)]
MHRRNWKRLQPTSQDHAMRLCLDYAKETKNLSVERVADRMGIKHWTLYKYVDNGSLPSHLIRAFEHACECPYHYLTRYLCHSAHLMAIDLPIGRKAKAKDINALQGSCTGAIDALLKYGAGDISADDTLAALTTTMEDLAYQRAEVERVALPELDFEG